MNLFLECEIARKIADILEECLDYLTGKEEVQIHKDSNSRILEVSKFEETDKNHIFSVIDAFIAKKRISFYKSMFKNTTTIKQINSKLKQLPKSIL